MKAGTIADSVDPEIHAALSQFLMALGDDGLILGHRLSEWCGHAPALEEDIALANIALDEIGRANVFLMMAGELEGNGRDQDDLAFLRDERDFNNVLLVEQPNGDFGYTIARQFIFDAWALPFFEMVAEGDNEFVSGLAKKAVKELTYHLRHSSQWVVRLGDGTEESHNRIQRAFDDLWTYTGELFDLPRGADTLIENGLIPGKIANIRAYWEETVSRVMAEATLTRPDDEQYMRQGGRDGKHTEYLGPLLAEMQILARSYPEAKW